MIIRMSLDIENFGSINEAHIELKKINIISGINGSGKSTASKLLYCFLIANSKEGYYLANNSIYERFIQFIFYWHNKISSAESDSMNIDRILTLLNNNINLENKSFNSTLKKKIAILKDIITPLTFPDKEKFIDDLKDIEKLIEVNENDNHRYFNVSNVLLNSEFNFSELSEYQKSYVYFHGNIGDCDFAHKINFNNDKIGVILNDDYVDCLDFEDVVYIESPSIFDLNIVSNSSFLSKKVPYHLSHLNDLLSKEKNIQDVFDEEYNKKTIDFQQKFNDLLNGVISFDSKNQDFTFKQESNVYSMKNTASGIKQIGIIQLLLENRYLKENSFLFIDEPEINLHPKWQVNFAEMLVLLVKDLNVHVYINSHSPQFIEALEVFSQKYDLIDDTKFYLSENSPQGFKFKEIKHDELELLYNDLGDPYNIIDEIRAENLYKLG